MCAASSSRPRVNQQHASLAPTRILLDVLPEHAFYSGLLLWGTCAMVRCSQRVHAGVILRVVGRRCIVLGPRVPACRVVFRRGLPVLLLSLV